MGRHGGHVARVVCAAGLFFASTVALAKDLPQPGANVLHKDVHGRDWCVTIASVDVGVDGQPWAWFTIDIDSRRIGHAPVADFGTPCRPAVYKPLSRTDPASLGPSQRSTLGSR
jgi:hypothetical protein